MKCSSIGGSKTVSILCSRTKQTHFFLTGTTVGDPIECRAISEMFFKTRKNPLLIGSVKSNMGHAEITAGLCSTLKALAIFRLGVIPKTIYAEPIDTTLPGIKDGNLKVS